jgi:hypothetical protein
MEISTGHQLLLASQSSLNPPSFATESFPLAPLRNPGNYRVEIYAGYPPMVPGQLKGTYDLSVPQSKCITSYYPSSNQTGNTAATTTTSTAAATTTTTNTAAATTTYRRDVQLVAPDGYRAGGRFTLKVWGPPNQTVEIAAWQNSLSHGRTAYGTTDSSGYFEISGVWAPEHAGRWQEDIYVGGELVGRLDFEITAPQQTQPAPDTVVILPPANQPPQPGSGSSVGIPSDGTGNGNGDAAPSGQAGFSISPTVLLVGAVALLFLLGGRK